MWAHDPTATNTEMVDNAKYANQIKMIQQGQESHICCKQGAMVLLGTAKDCI